MIFWDVLVGVNRRDSGNVKNSSGRRIDNNSDAEYTSVIATKFQRCRRMKWPSHSPTTLMKPKTNGGVKTAGSTKNKQEPHYRQMGFQQRTAAQFERCRAVCRFNLQLDSGIKKAQNNFDSIGGNLQNTFEFRLPDGMRSLWAATSIKISKRC